MCPECQIPPLLVTAALTKQNAPGRLYPPVHVYPFCRHSPAQPQPPKHQRSSITRLPRRKMILYLSSLYALGPSRGLCLMISASTNAEAENINETPERWSAHTHTILRSGSENEDETHRGSTTTRPRTTRRRPPAPGLSRGRQSPRRRLCFRRSITRECNVSKWARTTH